jgi:hypothetical protein
VKDLIGRTEKRAAIQSVLSTWLRKRGGERRFNDHVIGKRGEERVLMTMWLGEEVIEKCFLLTMWLGDEMMKGFL